MKYNISHYFNVSYFINEADWLHVETEKASMNNLLLIIKKKKKGQMFIAGKHD